MTDLPRLELTEDPNKKNDFIIFRYSVKDKIKKTDTKKNFNKRHRITKSINNIKTKRSKTKRSETKRSKTKRSNRKGFLNLFYN